MEKLYGRGAGGQNPQKLFAVLNARFHEQEAYIVAEAGVPGAITIATNMAGRGTDIKLGGSLDYADPAGDGDITDEAERARRSRASRPTSSVFAIIVLKAEDTIEVEPAKGNKPAKTVTRPGGLYIIGSERHESRRIDQSATRPLRPPGRSRAFEILPVAGR